MALTVDSFDNADLDLETLEAVVNGAPDRPNPGEPAGTVTSRLGRTMKTLAAALAAIGAAGSIGESPTDGKFYLRHGSDASWRALAAGPGMFIDPAAGFISTVDAKDKRVIWFNDYYPNDASTDDDAADAIVAAVNNGTLTNCTIKFVADRGRGPSGRYIFTRLHEFITNIYLKLDFTGATTRFTTANAQWRYTEQYLGTSEVAANPSYFVVSGGVHQYSVTDTTGARPFMWNMKYQPSRVMGTGYAENMRIIPQVSNSHYLGAAFVTKNTWYFSNRNVHVLGRAGFILAGGGDWYGCVIEQRSVCIVTTILENCEYFYVDRVISWGYEQMTGFEATGLGDGTGGSVNFARGKKVVQGGASGYLSRSDGGYGYTFSMSDVTGAFSPGNATVYSADGTINFGVINLTSVATYYQASEALAFGSGSTAVNVNYFLSYTEPEPGKHTLDIQFGDGHIAYVRGILRITGSATTAINGLNFSPIPSAYRGDSVAFDMASGNLFTMVGTNSTTNQALADRPGGLTYTAVRLRSMNSVIVVGNGLENWDTPIDVDNTVKDGVIAMNTGGASSGPIKSTANRFQGGTSIGLRIFANGKMGTGIDQDDNQTKAYTPIITSASGAIASYNIRRAFYKLMNGILTLDITFEITNRGSATGTLKVTLPNILAGSGTQAVYLDDTLVPVSVNQVAMVAGYTRSAARLIEIYGDYDSEPMKIGGAYGNYIYRLNTSLILSAA